MRGEIIDDRLIHVARLAARAWVGSVGREDFLIDFTANGCHFVRAHGSVGTQVAVFDEEIDFGAG